eukprot:5593003-Alexandrium_andersonii.AAC.1
MRVSDDTSHCLWNDMFCASAVGSPPLCRDLFGRLSHCLSCWQRGGLFDGLSHSQPLAVHR